MWRRKYFRSPQFFFLKKLLISLKLVILRTKAFWLRKFCFQPKVQIYIINND